MTLSIETGFRAWVLGSVTVANLIGDRMAPHSQSQQTRRPYAVYTRISDDHQRHLKAASGLTFTRLQIDLHSNDYDEVVTLAEAIRMRADGYRGTVTVGAQSIDFQNVELLDAASSYETPNDGTDLGPHGYRMDFRISALEPVPTLT